MKITPPKVEKLNITGAALRSVQAADEKAEHFYKVANELSAKLFARLQKEESCALDLRLAYEAWEEFGSHWSNKRNLTPRWQKYDPYGSDGMENETFRGEYNFHTTYPAKIEGILKKSKNRLKGLWIEAGISLPEEAAGVIQWLRDCESIGL